MPIVSAAPTIVDGVEYPYLAVSMAIAPVYGDTNVSGNLAMTAVPYRVDAEGNLHYLHDQPKRLVVGDIFAKAATDPDFAQFLGALMGGGQVYLTAKGL